MHVSQYLILTVMPFTFMSLVRGNLSCCGVPLDPVSAVPASSGSGSGGCALRGIIPGSRPEVSSNNVKSYIN